MPAKIIQSARNRLKRGPVKGETLTGRQAEILTYVLQCWLSGFVPSVREIGDEFGIGSPNGVVCHLTALRAKGYVGVENGRALLLTDKALGLAL